MLAVFFARDEEIRHRFVVGRPSDEWLEASFIGNWFVPLTPSEADELGGGSCSRSSTSCAAARRRPQRRRRWSR